MQKPQVCMLSTQSQMHTHTHSIVLLVLEAQTGAMSAEATSMHALHTITNAHTHSIVLLVLEAHRKCCIITSCSTLSSQSHNTYFHFVHKFIHDLAPTLVLLQREGVRYDITTAHLGNHP